VRVLAIDTATEACSAAVLTGALEVERYAELVKGHAERILSMVDEVLAAGGLALIQLDAIAFGRGPGAFTGVRLAASIAQGLAFASQRGVIAVSDLQALAQRGLDATPEAHTVLACSDARMGEVYWGSFARAEDGSPRPLGAEAVGPPETVRIPPEAKLPVYGVGRGFRAYPELRACLQHQLGGVHDEFLPRALEVARLARAFGLGAAVEAEAALPVYLRDEVARPPSRK
jgi:tRNA threonylcarbamoyladenosine biosynthesis protein TsaB